MTDCPVSLGLACVHFRALEGRPEPIDPKEADRLFDALLDDYLTRPYHHRVRSLAPEPDPWRRRRDRIAEEYAALEPELEEGIDDETYEAEKTRLVEARRRRDAEREERKRQEDDAKRAAKGLPPRVPRDRPPRSAEAARRAEAEGRGEEEDAPVDDLPPGSAPPVDAPAAPPAENGGADGEFEEIAPEEAEFPPDSAGAPETGGGGGSGSPFPRAPSDSAAAGPPRRRRRRRRRGRGGGGGAGPPP
jgi:hypothetical protein